MRFGRLIGATLLIGGLARQVLRPRRIVTIEERLAMLPRAGAPVQRPVTIFWNRQHVPFIIAASDRDLAVGLGVVHAHLRLGQIEVLRRLAQGRVAEMIGPLGVEADRLLRTLDVGRAVPAILAAMPAATREWLDAFAQGINHYLANTPSLPEEFPALRMRREPWSVADVVTLGRLLSADFSWIVWSRMLRIRNEYHDWPLLWRRLLGANALSPRPEFTGAVARSGSNTLAIAPGRTVGGAAMLASDPHLPFSVPGPWIIAGCSAPGFNAVGLMLPGMPFIALGRNRSIAWGGTNLHAASSDLVAVPADAPMRERAETVAVRWGPKRQLPIRETEWGPVLSDVPLLGIYDVLALRWMGHRPSDEFTAMLGVNRARTWDEFHTALAGFGVPGQNMVFADVRGRIGRVTAAHLPQRTRADPTDVALPPGGDADWSKVWTARDLPWRVDPDNGYVVSANDRPDEAGTIVGYHFSPPDRKQRLEHLIAAQEKLSVPAVAGMQRDVQSATAHAECRRLLAWIRQPVRTPAQRDFMSELAAWDGDYAAGSRGALAFELLSYHLARALVPAPRRNAYEAAWGTRTLIWEDLLAADASVRARALDVALARAAKDIRANEVWSDRHRVRLRHPLAAVPLLGRSYRFADRPAGGSSETVMKTAHALTRRRHASGYGSGARHISDLGDADANFFVLLGGQDGWFGSTTQLDQLPLWDAGDYLTVPLRAETARDTFPFGTELAP